MSNVLWQNSDKPQSTPAKPKVEKASEKQLHELQKLLLQHHQNHKAVILRLSVKHVPKPKLKDVLMVAIKNVVTTSVAMIVQILMTDKGILKIIANRINAITILKIIVEEINVITVSKQQNHVLTLKHVPLL